MNRSAIVVPNAVEKLMWKGPILLSAQRGSAEGRKV